MPDHSSNYRVQLVLWLGLILIIRLVSLKFNNSQLFFDEAQYWFWAQEFEFGYFSKPPLLAWLIAGVTQICGSDSAFYVRLISPIMHTGTAVVLYGTASMLFSQRVGFWSAIAYATIPGVSLSSTIVSTDVPLMCYWAIALYFYFKLMNEDRLLWAILMGLALGLAINAKYAGVYFILCAFIHWMVERKTDVPFKTGNFWIGIAISLLMLIPNLIWNAQYGFITFSHTGDNIQGAGFSPNFSGFFEFLGAQFGVFGPILFGMFLATLYQMRKDSISPAHKALVSFSLPILCLVLLQAFISKANANWAAVTYIAATILVTEVMVNRIDWKWMRLSLGINGFVFIAISIAVCFAGSGQLGIKGFEPFKRTQGAKEMSAIVEQKLAEGDYDAIVTTDRKMSALIQYNLRHLDIAKLAFRIDDKPHDHFELKHSFQEFPQDKVLVVSRSSDITAIEPHFLVVKPLGEQAVEVGDFKKLYFFSLKGSKLLE